MAKLMEHLITDLKSARAIIALMKQTDPKLEYVTVPYSIKKRILEDLRAATASVTVRGVWIVGKG